MKAASHKALTQLAIDRYRSGGESVFARALADARWCRSLLRGTTDEDGISLRRATNWHFYPANEALRDAEFVLFPLPRISAVPTSRKVMGYRRRQLCSGVKDGASKSLFATFGRLLHHVQDMSTPSHVVPVYHGPGRGDPFEDYLLAHWADLSRGVDARTEKGVSVDTSNEDGCEFDALYEHAAARTLNYLSGDDARFPVIVNDSEVFVGADSFWRPYEPGAGDVEKVPFRFKGFGSFGPLGKQFGRLCVQTDEGARYEVAHTVYRDLARRFIGYALADTLAAFELFSRLIESSFPQRDEPYF